MLNKQKKATFRFDLNDALRMYAFFLIMVAILKVFIIYGGMTRENFLSDDELWVTINSLCKH